MAHKKKCFVGPAFNTLDALLGWIDSGFWVFIGSKPFHPSFALNRMLGRVREEIRCGDIRACHNENGEPYCTDRLTFGEVYHGSSDAFRSRTHDWREK